MRVNPELLWTGYLKKQSQFVGGHNYVKSVIVELYVDLAVMRLRKNKAKQSQLDWIPAYAGMTMWKGKITPKGVGRRKEVGERRYTIYDMRNTISEIVI